MRTQLVNNCEGPIYAQIQPPKGATATAGNILNLSPGLNLVDSKLLVELRTNPTFELFFKTALKPSKAPERNPANFGKPMLEVIGKELPDDYPLKGLTLAAAKSIISQIQNTDVLKKWSDEATESDVRAAIMIQIKTLTSSISADDQVIG